MPRFRAVLCFLILCGGVLDYMNWVQRKMDYQDFLQLRNRYISLKQQSRQTPISKAIEWPRLLKVWMLLARQHHCQIIRITPLSKQGFRLKIYGTFEGLQSWLKMVHIKLPELKLTRVVFMQQVQEHLQMDVQGYREM